MPPLLRTLRNKIEHSISLRGVRGTLTFVPRAAVTVLRQRVRRVFSRRYRAARAREIGFDQELGIDTYASVGLANLDIDSGNKKYGAPYQPTPAKTFEELIALLNIEHDGYTFVDVGSGKGRVLFLAALHPFKRIVGIEFSRELCAIAEQNIARFSHPKQRCHAIESVCIDAARYELPPEPTVVYMFNPFGAPVMTRFLENLERSLAEHPRDVFVVYYNALHRDVFDRSPWLREIASRPARDGDEPWAIYRAHFTDRAPA